MMSRYFTMDRWSQLRCVIDGDKLTSITVGLYFLNAERVITYIYTFEYTMVHNCWHSLRISFHSVFDVEIHDSVTRVDLV